MPWLTPCRGSGGSVATQILTLVGDLAGQAKSQPEPCTERYWSTIAPFQDEVPYVSVALSTRQPSLGRAQRLEDVPAFGAGLCRDHRGREVTGGGGWRGVGLAVWRGRGGGGGAVVVVLQVQFIDKVVDVLMQLKFQQSRVCTGSSSTECWTFLVAQSEGTCSANCAEDCSWCRRPCDQQRQVRAVHRFKSSAPDSVHPQSGGQGGACSPWAEGGVVRREGDEGCPVAFLDQDVCQWSENF